MMIAFGIFILVVLAVGSMILDFPNREVIASSNNNHFVTVTRILKFFGKDPVVYEVSIFIGKDTSIIYLGSDLSEAMDIYNKETYKV